MNAAAMPSVAPTVTSVSRTQSHGTPASRALCDATAWRSSGTPIIGGYWLWCALSASAAARFIASGPSSSG
jgi:hypothetical protein